MRIRLWRGYHSKELQSEVRSAWMVENELLILCPPHLDDFTFCRFLPKGETELIGDWTGVQLPSWVNQEPRDTEYSKAPRLGVFTSGTVSGQPRLVLYTKANVQASLDAIFELFDASRVRKIFCYAQPFHTFGLLLGYVLSIQHGFELLTPEGKYSSASHELRLSITDPDLITLGTPAHFHDLIETVKSGKIDISPSYSCIIGGASVSVDLWNKVRSVLRIEHPSIGYGCTEAAPGITHLPPGHAPREDSEIGYPLKNLTSDFSETAVKIRGPSLCTAIIDSSGVSFSDTREIRDSVRMREDGVLMFCGRSDLVLNRGGEKHSLEFLEASISRELGVELIAVAVAVPHSRLGQDLGLLLKRRADRSDLETLSDLRTFVSAQMRLRLNPEFCEFVDELPRNASFKPDRKAAGLVLTSRLKQTSIQNSSEQNPSWEMRPR